MKTVLLAVVAVILMAVAGGAGYYFGNDNGMKQAQNIRTDFFNNRLGGQGGGTSADAAQAQRGGGQNGAQGAGQFAGRPLAAGTVKSVDGTKVTVTQQDGTTTTVTLDAKAVIQKTVTGAPVDIQPGMRITVVEQTSGNTTTQRIQLTSAQP
jgi:hypothetical protein